MQVELYPVGRALCPAVTAGNGTLMQIELRDVSYGYAAGGGRVALDNVSLKVHTGEAVLVLGHNGAGKSTLLHLMAGLLKPSRGQVVFDDGVRTSLALQQPERQLFCGSVFDEVAFGLRQANRSKKMAFGRRLQGDFVSQEVESVLLAVGLDPQAYAPRHPQQLSGGEKRRLAIACCLAVKPCFLLLDEPFAGLDGPGRRSLLQVLDSLRSSGTGVVVTSHTVEPLLPIVDRVVLLQEGRVAGDGSSSDVLGDLSLLSACGVEPLGIAAVAKRLQERGWPALEWSTPDRLADSILGRLNRLNARSLGQSDDLVESRLQAVTSLPETPLPSQLPDEASTPRIGARRPRETT